ncbi:MAG TPA: thioredoxin-disulfide reductase [Anaerolineaceae bacterium]|nr:thioredoxin-disulfide reductase [Anaerolineaceae bacterium]
MENNEKDIESVIILGSGPAGLAAALYAARAELKPLLFTGTEVGGQAATTSVIENYPGFPDGVEGGQLAELFTKNAEKFGARIEYDMVTAADLSKSPFKVSTYGKDHYAQVLIVTTGASANKLNVPGEKELTGRGVSYCATCDGWFFKDKKVAVVGGGDSALEEGLFLTRYASSVTIIHRRDELRAGALLQKRARENPKISFIWDTVVEEIKGEGAVSGLQLKDVKTGETRELAIGGVFVFIGHSPNTELFRDWLKLDEKGYIRIDQNMQTSVAGVYAAGEVADSRYRQVVISAGMGAAAAIEATRFLESQE